MLIDIVVSSLKLRDGGPTRTVIQLAEALSIIPDINVRLISQSLFGSQDLLPQKGNIKSFIEYTSSCWALKFGLTGLNALNNSFASQHPNILHCNGIWHPVSYWSSRAARISSIPLVLQTHGMLEPWALSWHPIKKRIALALYQQYELKSAAILVATSEQEADNLRRFGLRQPIAIIPNGIELYKGALTGTVKSNNNKSIRKALFLSRVHPKKGLANFLKAWSSVRPKNWLLQIAGPDQSGHLQDILDLAVQLGVKEQVEYLGEFDDHKKWAIYRAADLFVLPTFSENFGIVVAEALLQGTPVITTTGTPWKDLHTYGCGWWVEPSVDGLRQALFEAVNLPADHLAKMGQRGHNYVERFDWSVIARQMLDTYQWVLKQGPKPDCVRLD